VWSGELRGGSSERSQAAHGLTAFPDLEPGEGFPHPVRIEQRVSITDLDPRLGEPKADPASVLLVAGATDEAESDQTDQLKGNRGRSDPEATGQLPHGQGMPGIELLEDPGEVRAQPGAAFRLPDFAAAARGKQGRVGREDGAGGGVEHDRNI